MTGEFAAKIIMAKKLEYEAIKSIMPENIKKLADRAEFEAVKFLTQTVSCILSETESASHQTKQTKKVTVE